MLLESTQVFVLNRFIGINLNVCQITKLGNPIKGNKNKLISLIFFLHIIFFDVQKTTAFLEHLKCFSKEKYLKKKKSKHSYNEINIFERNPFKEHDYTIFTMEQKLTHLMKK